MRLTPQNPKKDVVLQDTSIFVRNSKIRRSLELNTLRQLQMQFIIVDYQFKLSL